MTGVNGNSDIRWMMDAIRSMPLPVNMRGWDQVVSIELEDRPDLRYQWLIEGDRWQVLEGQAMRPTLRLVVTEDDLARRLVNGYDGSMRSFGYRLLRGAIGLNAPSSIQIKCHIFVTEITDYLWSTQELPLREWQAAQRGKKYGIGAAMPVDQLVNTLWSADVEARKAAADALEELGWTPPPERAEAYWAAKWEWSKGWAEAAKATNPSALLDVKAAVEYLVKYLRWKDIDKCPPASQSIVRALVQVGPPAMAEIWPRAWHPTSDFTYQYRVQAAAMGIFRAPRPVELRIGLLKYVAKPSLFGIRGTLDMLMGWHDSLQAELVAAGPRVIEALVAALHDEASEMRRSAAEALGRIGDPRTVDPLGALSVDPDPSVRSAAKTAIKEIRAHKAAPVPPSAS